MKPDGLRGHLDGVIMAALEAGPRHGYAIASTIEQTSDGQLQLQTGTLYPALHRLERAGWIDSEWGIVDGRKRRVYTLTTSGQGALRERRTAWSQRAELLNKLLST